MGSLWQDVRYGLRQLARSPGFTLVAVLTLALGIGANSAIFSVVDAVLLRPLPYGEPERLVLIWNRMEATHFPKASVAAPDVADYRSQARLFEGFAATNSGADVTLSGGGEPAQIKLANVTANFFSLLRVRPAIGHDFAPGDDSPLPPNASQDSGPPPPSVVLLSHGFWRRRFGGDPQVVGQSLQVNGRSLQVIGVLPASFTLLIPSKGGIPTEVDAWAPLRFDLATGARDGQFLRVVARLKPGVTLAQAQAEMDAIAARQRQEFQYHRNMGMHIDVSPMHRDVVERVRPLLLAFTGAVAFVLLIACANVANLLLARATARGREIAVRTALGAGRGRLLRQMLTESALLSLAGGALGLLLAYGAVRLLVALGPAGLPRLSEIGLDASTLGFTLAATAAAALAFGLAPALAASSRSAGALRERGEGSGGSRLRGGLVVAEVALSLVLLIGAGLLLRSFASMVKIRPGFEPRGVLTYNLSLPVNSPVYGAPAARVDFFRRMEERVAALPGVEAVGAVSPMPLSGRLWIGPYGKPEDPVDSWTKNEVNYRVITPGYFQAMGTRLLAGRFLSRADVEGQRDVAVVDRIMAELVWPGQSPVGERLGVDLFGDRRQIQVEIVGVVDAIRQEDLTKDGRQTIYFPLHLFPLRPMTVAVRAQGDPAALAAEIRGEVRKLDREIPIYDVRMLEEYVSQAMGPTRFAMQLIALFAGVALLLASVGLYGVIAYAVRQRTHEIGIRLALGAQRGAIQRQVVGNGFRLVLAGVGLGLVAALALTRSIANLLYGVTPTDPATFAGLSALLVVVAFWASYLPARRAARVDPMESLRGE